MVGCTERGTESWLERVTFGSCRPGLSQQAKCHHASAKAPVFEAGEEKRLKFIVVVACLEQLQHRTCSLADILETKQVGESGSLCVKRDLTCFSSGTRAS